MGHLSILRSPLNYYQVKHAQTSLSWNQDWGPGLTPKLSIFWLQDIAFNLYTSHMQSLLNTQNLCRWLTGVESVPLGSSQSHCIFSQWP